MQESYSCQKLGFVFVTAPDKCHETLLIFFFLINSSDLDISSYLHFPIWKSWSFRFVLIVLDVFMEGRACKYCLEIRILSTTSDISEYIST